MATVHVLSNLHVTQFTCDETSEDVCETENKYTKPSESFILSSNIECQVNSYTKYKTWI